MVVQLIDEQLGANICGEFPLRSSLSGESAVEQERTASVPTNFSQPKQVVLDGVHPRVGGVPPGATSIQ